MPTAKQDIEAMAHALPEDATIEEAQYRLYVLDKIRQGLDDVAAGRTTTNEDFRAEIATWRDR